MEKLISVIIPVYNREHLIGECLRSVLGQTHKNLQVILIDDGSTDGTVEICKEFEASDSRVKLLQPGPGAYPVPETQVSTKPGVTMYSLWTVTM
jgi:glycosyltransferase involved in cell wall biosynthesis